jgi:hypothetical protein
MTVLSARHRRVLPIFAFLLFASRAVLACSGRAHVEIAESGVYALDYAAIVAAQPQLKDCRAADLLLLNGSDEVPIRVIDDGRGGFSRIEWLGQRLHGPQSWFDQYSNNNVYLLGATPGAHARLREIAAPSGGTPATLQRRMHFEHEELMIRLGNREMKPGEEPDVWQWAKLTPIDPQPFASDFDLADLRAAGTAQLTLDFRGESSIAGAAAPKPSDHRVEVYVNDKLVQTLDWDGRDEFRRTLAVPTASLREKGNRLSLRVPRRDLPGDAANFIIDVVMVNWFELTYPLRGDLDASAASFNADGAGPLQLAFSGTAPLVLFGSDGALHTVAALPKGRFRAAGAAENVDLYPFTGEARAPVMVRAVSSTDLRAERGGYDYVMVAHPRLRDAIEPLAQYHAAHGHNVLVVNVDDLYDEFNGGIIHPRAIRDFLAWGEKHWSVKPRFLLLVGDASVDIHHDVRHTAKTQSTTPNAMATSQFAPSAHLRPIDGMQIGGFAGMDVTAYKQQDPELPNRNLIPTWQVPSSSEGQSASDVPFVALKPGDFHPQLAVGRLPVVQPDEVRAIVRKTLAYLTDTTPGRWRHDMTFISTSEVASFKNESDKLAADLEQQGFAVKSLYTDFNEKDAARVKAVRTTLKQNLDDGGVLVHFLGHGGNYIWRVGPMGDLFALDDVAAMKNAGRYPLVLAMTCFSAPFDNPVADSIGERFLREPDKGAIAVFGASWSNSPSPAYSRKLIHEALQPGATVGEAIVRAKASIGDHTFVEMYNLLGDPALVLARPQQELRIQPTADRRERRLFVQLPMTEFGGSVDVDWIDAGGDILASRRYEARDRRFFLNMPDKAEKVVVYAADTRNGAQAFGGYAAPPTAPPPPSALPTPAAPVKTVAAPAAAPAAAGASRRADPIARLGFDSAPMPLAASATKRKQR